MVETKDAKKKGRKEKGRIGEKVTEAMRRRNG